MKDDVLVSVAMTAYNQEKFIAQSLESIINQKCDFNYEIIIGEDCSTDQTRDIIKDYQQKYPEIVKPIFRDNNVGAQQNSVEVIHATRGKFIAFCEGDDYWVDTSKLQKQVDHMNTHEYAGVFSKVKYVNKDDELLGYSEDVPKDILPLSFEYLLQKNPVHTCSFMIRRDILIEIEDIIIRAPYGDFVMFVASSYYGKLGFIDEMMAVYRKNVGVMHTWTNANAQLMRIDILNLFSKDERFTEMKKMLRISKRFHYYKLTIYKVKEHRFMDAFKFYIKTLYFSLFVLLADNDEVCHKVTFKEYLKLSVSVIPFSEYIYRKLKRID